MAKKERPSFEEALRKLESIVSKLEDSEVTLEESIQLYEEGMKLSKYCSETLEDAVLRIEKINTGSKTDTDAKSSD
jgi:exodeoxyribonuclease VII small subunit